MSEGMLSCMRQKFKKLIADAYMTFQKTRLAKHGAHPWQKHHFNAKEFMRKIKQKGIFTSIPDRFQIDEVFHESHLEHNWTEEWCKYLDYIRTIDITHNVCDAMLSQRARLRELDSVRDLIESTDTRTPDTDGWSQFFTY